jgi:hypothetical protein
LIRIKKVLVATDFSEPSFAALRSGHELARTFEATLEVLHVADNVYVMYGAEVHAPAIPELQQEIEAAVQRQVDDRLTDAGVGFTARTTAWPPSSRSLSPARFLSFPTRCCRGTAASGCDRALRGVFTSTYGGVSCRAYWGCCYSSR